MKPHEPGSDGPTNLGKIDRLIHEPARLLIMSNLFVLDSADFVFLTRQTGLTLGNLSSHMSKLEDAGYIEVEKTFVGKRPHNMLHLTEAGRTALLEYRETIAAVMEPKPDSVDG